MNDESFEPLEIPINVLSDAALVGVMEDFILREGTDYGGQEVSHEKKIKQVRSQIESGEIKITFDPKTESVNLVTKREWKKQFKNHVE